MCNRDAYVKKDVREQRKNRVWNKDIPRKLDLQILRDEVRENQLL